MVILHKKDTGDYEMNKEVQTEYRNIKIIGMLDDIWPFATINFYREILESVIIKTEMDYPCD